MKISEVMESIGPREIPIIDWNSHIDDIIRVMAESIHTRLVYAVDEEKRLKGMISVGSLLRHIYPHHFEGKIHPHGILKRLTAETASHIMEKCSITTTPEESVDRVLRRMARSGAKEVPVLNKEGCIIGDITAIDLICYCHKTSGN
jgi:CBS-domain-containing membrane protein